MTQKNAEAKAVDDVNTLHHFYFRESLNHLNYCFFDMFPNNRRIGLKKALKSLLIVTININRNARGLR